MKYIYLLAAFLFATSANAAENITGLWTTIDDETGEEKSVVQIYEYEGKFFGRVVKLFKNVGDTIDKNDILATLYTNKKVKLTTEDINCFEIE